MTQERATSSKRGSLQPGYEGPGTVEGYKRELAQYRARESELLQALTRTSALLHEKDVAIRRQELLAEESHHRMLNNLQMIVALLSLQKRREANAEAASRLAIAADRVRAIADLHRYLHSMDGMPTVEFKQYLDEVCRNHARMSMSEERPDRSITVNAIELRLPTAIGIPLGLIVNEMVTNAIKHGKGPITVKLAPAGRRHALSVSNDDCHLPEGFDFRAGNGLGMSLVSSLAQQIGGELRIDRGDANDSTRFTVLFA